MAIYTTGRDVTHERSSYLAEAIAILKAGKAEKAHFHCSNERTEIRGYFKRADFGPDVFADPEILLRGNWLRPSLALVVIKSLGLRPEFVQIEKRSGVSIAKLRIDLRNRQFRILNGKCSKMGVQLAVEVTGGTRNLNEEMELFSKAGLGPP